MIKFEDVNGETFITETDEKGNNIFKFPEVNVGDKCYKLEGENEMKEDLRKLLKPGDQVLLRNGAIKSLDCYEDFRSLNNITNDLIAMEELNENLDFTGIGWATEPHDNDIMEIIRPVATYKIWQREESILDKEEKEYLSAVIRPFRNRVDHIVKFSSANKKEYITIYLTSEDDSLPLPFFEKNTMYKGMELRKKYTLEELEL